MSEHQFIVTVSVDDGVIPENDEYNRTPRDFAYSALWAASLREAAHLDGFADLTGDAHIYYVEDL